MSSFLKIAVISVMFTHGVYASHSDTVHLGTPTPSILIGSHEKPSSISTIRAIPQSFCGRPPIGPQKKFSFEDLIFSHSTSKSPVKELNPLTPVDITPPLVTPEALPGNNTFSDGEISDDGDAIFPFDQ